MTFHSPCLLMEKWIIPRHLVLVTGQLYVVISSCSSFLYHSFEQTYCFLLKLFVRYILLIFSFKHWISNYVHNHNIICMPLIHYDQFFEATHYLVFDDSLFFIDLLITFNTSKLCYIFNQIKIYTFNIHSWQGKSI